MGKIGVNQLSEGMIVDDPVSDFHGTILMQKGTAITPNGIKILKTWGVLEVSIDEASEKSTAYRMSLTSIPASCRKQRTKCKCFFNTPTGTTCSRRN